MLVVGAGHAGCQVALALRQRRFQGSIGILSDEGCLPYERPPLSKDFLSGKRSAAQIALRDASAWFKHNVEILLEQRVEVLDPERKALGTQSGASLRYGKLVWAAGGRPRRLDCPGAQLQGVHLIRTRNDVEALRADIREAGHVAVIGGGYLGLETAATLTGMGQRVTVVESAPRLLARVAGPDISGFYAREHQSHGITLELGATVTALEPQRSRIGCVRLSDGRGIPADVVVAGIGVVPNIEVIAAAGAAVADGVVVDGQCRTTLPEVFAIGDCAFHPNRYSRRGAIRLESVQNAMDQATTVAKCIAGEVATYDSTPWFWSDQYDLKLQTVGLSGGFDQAVVRGIPEQRHFSVVYLHEGRVIALDCVNSPRDFIQGKHLVARHVVADPALLADVAVELKELAT